MTVGAPGLGGLRCCHLRLAFVVKVVDLTFQANDILHVSLWFRRQRCFRLMLQ